jgi:hypothetical protein
LRLLDCNGSEFFSAESCLNLQFGNPTNLTFPAESLVTLAGVFSSSLPISGTLVLPGFGN